jgi:hypothetical protein
MLNIPLLAELLRGGAWLKYSAWHFIC